MRRSIAIAAVTFGLLTAPAVAPLALGGEGNGTSNSQGANSVGNSVSSGAQPQPADGN